MKTNKHYLLFLVSILTFQFNFAQSAPIIIDGLFDDWNTGLTTFTDATETTSGVDFLELQVTNDADYLYIKIKADKEFDLTEGTTIRSFFLHLDTDNNATTGDNVRSDYGAELSIDFANRIVYNNFAGTPDAEVRFADIEFRPAPTVTSEEFEFAISRDAIPDEVNALFPSSTIKLLLENREDSDWVPNVGSVFTYTFDETPTTPYTLIDFDKTDNSFIRVMAYNALQDGLLNSSRVDDFERIIKAAKPDIVGFIESSNTSATFVKSLFDTWFPLGTADGWYVEKHGGEVTVSRWEITQRWDSLTRQFPVLIDLPESYGIDLLYTNAHLNCCGADDARQDQVDQYAAFILDAKSPGGDITLPQNTPFIYSGDLNLVGLSQQLTTLVTGDIQNTGAYGAGGKLDWDNTDLHEENALQSDINMGYTWRSDTSSFPTGKLDFIIFSDYILTSEKSFVIQTEVMSNDRLNMYGLTANDSSTASDHFPVIADFSIDKTLSTPEESLITNTVYPNPTFGNINVSFKDYKQYIINVYDITGNSILSTEIENNSVLLNIDSVASGIYFLRVQDKELGNSQTIKIIKE